MLNYITDFHAHVKKHPTHFCKKIHIACGMIEKLLKQKGIEFCETDVLAFETMCRLFSHWKGIKKKIKLDIWQRWLVACILGIKEQSKENPNEYVRYFKECRVFIAKKAGKSLLMGLLAIWALLFDRDRDGAEVYLLATKKEQAKICYDNVTVFRKQNIEIQKRCKEIYADGSKYIFSPDNNGTIKYLSSSKNGLQGKNPTWAFLDEAQEVKDMSVIEAVRTGMATRKQPMFVSMSTAGVTPNSAYHSQYSQIEAMCEQKKFDDKLRVFFAVFEIDIDDSIDDKKCWIKANPALLDGRPKLEFLEKEYELAKIGEDNRSLPTFIAFHLNRSCDDASSFYDTNEIKNGRREITSELYYDTYAVLGVDLSTTTDLTCCSCLIPYKHEDEDNTYSFITLQRYFMPKNRLEKNSNTDKVIYNNFTMTKSKDEVCQNLLHLSQGDCVNYSDIVDFILELRDKYKIAIVKIGYDLALSSQFVCRMIENGFSVEEKKFDGNKKLVSRSIGELTDIRQGKYLSEPIKQSKMLFEQGRIFYDTTNALLPYCCSNAKVLVDKDGRYEIVKKESRGRIDGIISWLTAYQAFLSVKDTSFEVEILPYEKMTTQRSWFGKIKEKL